MKLIEDAGRFWRLHSVWFAATIGGGVTYFAGNPDDWRKLVEALPLQPAVAAWLLGPAVTIAGVMVRLRSQTAVAAPEAAGSQPKDGSDGDDHA